MTLSSTGLAFNAGPQWDSEVTYLPVKLLNKEIGLPPIFEIVAKLNHVVTLRYIGKESIYSSYGYLDLQKVNCINSVYPQSYFKN